MKSFEPMLCQIGGKEILDSKNYLFQPKLDGTRALIYVKGNTYRIVNRRGKNIVYRFPEFKSLPEFVKAKECVLDAEIIVYDEKGLPNFNLMQQREAVDKKLLIELRSKEMPATIVFFDLLEKDGQSLIFKPLEERMKALKETVKENAFIQLIVTTTDGKKLWRQVKKLNLEGLIAKEKKSSYFPGKRRKEWLKIKNLKTLDCVVVGWTERTTDPNLIGSMALALFKQGQLNFIGNVGTGWNRKQLLKLSQEFKKLEIRKPRVINPPEKWQEERYHWMKPNLVCEIEFLEVTKYNELRAPSFQRMRYDKKPEDCVWEELKQK